MKDSAIEWTDHTFNPWIGCTKVSPGCTNCYAEARDQRFANGVHWGKGAPRQRTSAGNWRQPRQWNDIAKRTHRSRVFCASLADWLDDEVPIEWLVDLMQLIHDTPNLVWLLLTKRPENYFTRTRAALRAAGWPEKDACDAIYKPDNAWIGVTVEDQKRADERIPELLKIPARVRFLSCEPLLGPLDLSTSEKGDVIAPVDWIICGGESGPNRRPMDLQWARSLRDQCRGACAFFMKQIDKVQPIPDDLMIREFPYQAKELKQEGLL
jgi:protein gp37